MSQLKNLDCILLSGSAKDNFWTRYHNDCEFKTWLDNLLPEVHTCILQQQRTPWHLFTVMQHILVSVDQVFHLTEHLEWRERRLLGYVMFFHDLGKPATRQEREVANEIRDRFPSHEIESANVFHRTKDSFGFSEEEQDVIRTLILKHDIFMKLPYLYPKEDEARFQKFAEYLADEFKENKDRNTVLRYLIFVVKADNLAQNLKLSQSVLEDIAHVGEELLVAV